MTPRRGVLSRRRTANLPPLPDARAHVLVCDGGVPAPDRDSGSFRMTWLLRLFRSLDCHVTLFPLSRTRREPYASELERDGIEIAAGAPFAALARGREDAYDLVLLSRPGVAGELLPEARAGFPSALLVYDSVDLRFLRESRQLEVDPAAGLTPEHVRQEREQEVMCMRGSDVVAAISDAEAKLVSELVPEKPVIVLPNVHEVRASAGPPFVDRAGLLFIGGYRHAPNADAMRFYLDEILPRLRGRVDARLWALGPDPPEWLREREPREIVVPGWVRDADAYFDRCRVFVAPLRYGAGMKGKNGQALSLGLPVVTTPIGAEGMGLEDGVHALVADDAEAFADAVARLYTDRDLWHALSENGRRLVRERWSPDAVRRRLERLLEEARSRRAPPRYDPASTSTGTRAGPP